MNCRSWWRCPWSAGTNGIWHGSDPAWRPRWKRQSKANNLKSDMQRPGMIVRLASAWLAALAWLAIVPPAWAKDDFLAPEQAYRYTVKAEGERIVVSWKITPGY